MPAGRGVGGNVKLGEREAALLPAGQIADFDVEHFIAEAEPVERGVDAVVDGISAGGFHLVLQLFVLLKQGFELIGVFGDGGVGHLVRNVVEALVQLPQTGEGDGGFFAEGVVEIQIRVLREITGAGAAGELDLTGVGGKAPETGDDFHEGGLAAAVDTDEADVLTALDGEVDAVECDHVAESVGQVGDAEQSHGRGMVAATPCTGKCGADPA